MGIAGDVKDMLSISRKQRHDSYTDQFSRVFMMKMMMVGVLFVGMNWYADDINCIIPGALGIDGGFVKQACWINGLYVYEDIQVHEGQIGYYGIPREISNDGKYAKGMLCKTQNQDGLKDTDCKPMKKTFFLQYQYMVFYVAMLAGLYYSPYLIFGLVNIDLVSLKNDTKEKDAKKIVDNYFNPSINPPRKQRYRILGNLIVKILYIAVNVIAFMLTDSVLNNRYFNYGSEWIKWSKLDNYQAYDYMGSRVMAKPGNVLLPSFGLCEVRESAVDIKHEIINKHRFLCEMSSHILYQYIFVIIWFAMIFGIIISVIGLLIKLVDHLMTMSLFMRDNIKGLTLRECEYLQYLQKKDMSTYGEVLRLLKTDNKFGGANRYEQ